MTGNPTYEDLEKKVKALEEEISQHLRIEETLHASEEKYRLVVENANEGIMITQYGVVKYLNSKTEALTGYPRNTLLTLALLDLIHPEDKEDFIEAQHKKTEDGWPPTPHALRIVNRANEILWIELNTVSVTWEDAPATLNFLRDITLHRKMEAQLLQANKMEAMGTMAGGIAHDFNNLLMGIQGNASLMLLDTIDDYPHLDKLKSIEQLVQAGSALTRQLLGVARGGKYEVKPTHINSLVRSSADLFTRTKKEIRVYIQLPEDIWPVEVDKYQIDQVLLNLYINAWHAMPGGGDLYLETKNVILDEYYTRPYGVKPGKYVRITVTDTGIGMDESTLKRIFDPFFTTKEMGRGTGLGLASAYGIIRNHNGIINAYSEKGKGATFNIYLPVSEKEVGEEEVFENEILTGTETILLVDDEDTIIEIACQLLERLGYNVITAEGGKEAVEIYRKKWNQIDLVILDMIMPGVSGSDAFDRMREIHPVVKVLLSSGYSINGQAKAIIDRGCRGFIQKPFNLGELSRKLRQILD